MADPSSANERIGLALHGLLVTSRLLHRLGRSWDDVELPADLERMVDEAQGAVDRGLEAFDLYDVAPAGVPASLAGEIRATMFFPKGYNVGRLYVCPTCRATKHLGLPAGSRFPDALLCGYRGCEDEAVPPRPLSPGLIATIDRGLARFRDMHCGTPGWTPPAPPAPKGPPGDL